MTLCVSWIRKVNNTEELIFATDSCLSGGERWNSGVKLFELPRKDCLISFAGETNRTYPLILNLISSIKFDEHLSDNNTDINEVLDYLSNLFTTLCNSITDYGTQDFKDVLGDFSFLFGGYSWKEARFKLWELKYNFATEAFVHDQVTEDGMFYSFIGDELDKAKELLIKEINDNGKALSRDFDMEPFKVLLSMIREDAYDSISGAIQIAKIHPPGSTEFLGVHWPSIKGNKTFLGKDVSIDNNPNVNFIDPDTATIVGEELPERLQEIDSDIYGINTKFVEDCYPLEEGTANRILKTKLTKKQKSRLKTIFRDISYARFIESEQLEQETE
jgi:hypothetical protein